jgi:hypothetical protein
MSDPLSPARQAFVSPLVASVSVRSIWPSAVEVAKRGVNRGFTWAINGVQPFMVLGLKAPYAKIGP